MLGDAWGDRSEGARPAISSQTHQRPADSGLEVVMRRLAALFMLTLLGACSTVDDLSPLSPSASSSPTVAVRAPRFADSKPHEWDSGAPWNYAVHGTDVSKYQTSVDWPTAKAFAREVCARMAADDPDRYVLNMAKKERTGRIFLDYLRNDRTSTAVAPLSARARPGGTVSMPLNWTQVKAGLDPKKYTIRTAPDLIANSTAWEDYFDAAKPLKAAIKRLG